MLRKWLVTCLIALSPSAAAALCSYDGVYNAKTSVSQEFRDAQWVVRVHILSADYHWSDEDDSWTVYRLKAVRVYKGKMRSDFNVFTYRDSGGFYMDGNGAVPDLDRDYLLFLVSDAWLNTAPRAARGALRVNYSCGQSKLWADVTDKEQAQLRWLSRRHR